MHNKRKISVISLFFIINMILLIGCSRNSSNITLTNEQQIEFSKVQEYANTCDNGEDKTELLYRIKQDFHETNSDEKLDILVSIGKLKVDQLKLKQVYKANKIQHEQQSQYNKQNYKNKRDSITNKYWGTIYNYNSEISILDSKISEEYAAYLNASSGLNYGNLGTGFKENYSGQRYQEYLRNIQPYKTQKEQLEIQWKNKLEYDKYDKLYMDEQYKLQQKLDSLTKIYNENIYEIDLKIYNLETTL